VSIYDVIKKKRDGSALSREEIYHIIKCYCRGKAKDYHMSAFTMAVYFRGMDHSETAALCDAMAESGEMLDLSVFGNLSVDKHSTGGVGDKTTLIAAPIAAALGCKVAKMSGRGLGHTGGTVDKLESIPGFCTTLSTERFIKQVEDIGIAVIAPDRDIAPADKKLYSLRDVTATVDSIPLIASSVMSKKIAAGAKNIVLDIKYGSGAFMKTKNDAEALAVEMLEIGARCGRRCVAVYTNMDMPLGHAVGNALEVEEAVRVLRGEYVPRLSDVCTEIASQMVSLALGVSDSDAKVKVISSIKSGAAIMKFKEWISAQGGDSRIADDLTLLPKAKIKYTVRAPASGYISKMNAEMVGLSAMKLGAGRSCADDTIDPAAGIELIKNVGDAVTENEPLAVLHTSSREMLDDALRCFTDAVTVSDEALKPMQIIGGVMRLQ
jgi:pyrimidine-nucleoside phosphorylase